MVPKIPGPSLQTRKTLSALKCASLFAPYSRKPGLPFAWQPCWPIIVIEFEKSRFPHVSTPGFEIVIDAVTAVIPAFLTMAVWVRAEQNATRFEGRVQFREHAGQLLAGHMKE